GLFAARVLGRRLSIPQRLAVVIGLLALVVFTSPRPGQLYATMHFPPGPQFRTYLEEGIEGVVVTYQDDEHVVNYINGLIHGGWPNVRSDTEVIEALSFVKEPKNILIIGFGTGSFAEVVERQPAVQKITLVELNGTLIRNLERIP